MTEVDQLLAALDAAKDDAERSAILNAAPLKVREHLWAEMGYRQLMTPSAAEEAAKRAYSAFSEQLDTAPDDAARLRLIEGAQIDPRRGPEWLAEWHWRRHATAEDWRKRYVAALDPAPGGA